MDIIITLPKSVSWKEYEKELQETEKGGEINFKIPFFPTNTRIGEKCFITHNGFVKGFMLISGFKEKDFVCSVTGKKWKGKFVCRVGKFYKVEPKIFKGFQGWRYFKYD